MLGGVRTGCPLSSILFVLCVNPFIHLFLCLSDNPGFSVTRLCADDLGSALRILKSLRTHALILALARKVAGLHLEPNKCVIVITCVYPADQICLAVRKWLQTNVPDFRDFQITASGK